MAKRVVINHLIETCSECIFIDFEHMGIAEPVCRHVPKSFTPTPLLSMNEIDIKVNDNCPLEDDKWRV